MSAPQATGTGKGAVMVEALGLTQRYGSSTVLDRLSLSLGPGVVGLLGPNGAGKTTLIRTLATVMPPRSGQLRLNGRAVVDESSARVARRDIGYLPQSFGADRGMRVRDFVAYGAWLRGMPAKDTGPAVDRALARVDLADRARTKVRALSGGMRQRAGIAWAVVGEPAVVLLDEPTVGLDPRQRLHFRAIATSLAGSVVVLSTHLIDDVDAICDRTLVMDEGSLRFDGPTRDLAGLARDDLPGNTALERGYMSLLPESEQTL